LKSLLLFAAICTTFLCRAQSYKYYYGTLHTHSAYSDGNKDSLVSHRTTPFQDFEYAKFSHKMDFIGISEHNHLTAGLHLPDYHKGIQQANAANENGNFVCMYGMEWGVIANGGHLVIYGIDSLIGWEVNNYDIFNAKTDYTSLFQKIAARPNSFSYFAHPQSGDYNQLLTSAYNPVSDQAIVGTPFRSGPAFSADTTYSNPSSGDYLNQWFAFLAKGYHLGICIDHDTHNTVFGRSQKGRTAIMADTLTQESVMDAYRSMRFYATDDWNAKVRFTVNSKIMGSVFSSPGDPGISISVSDGDGETSGIPGSGQLPVVINTNNGEEIMNFTHPIANGSTHYYFAEIVQLDGDVIYTSPIWFTKDDLMATLPMSAEGIQNLIISPNPCSGLFSVSFESESGSDVEVELRNVLGQKVYGETIPGCKGLFSREINLESFQPGLYQLRVNGKKQYLLKF
jgi:Secretion system C-terminal sorting domain